jgi:hypothetical protein
LIIPSDELDFLHDPHDFDLVCSKILSALDQRDLFLEQTTQPELSLLAR